MRQWALNHQLGERAVAVAVIDRILYALISQVAFGPRRVDGVVFTRRAIGQNKSAVGRIEPGRVTHLNRQRIAERAARAVTLDKRALRDADGDD